MIYWNYEYLVPQIALYLSNTFAYALHLHNWATEFYICNTAVIVFVRIVYTYYLLTYTILGQLD